MADTNKRLNHYQEILSRWLAYVRKLTDQEKKSSKVQKILKMLISDSTNITLYSPEKNTEEYKKILDDIGRMTKLMLECLSQKKAQEKYELRTVPQDTEFLKHLPLLDPVLSSRVQIKKYINTTEGKYIEIWKAEHKGKSAEICLAYPLENLPEKLKKRVKNFLKKTSQKYSIKR